MAYVPEKIIQMRQCDACKAYFQARGVPVEAIVSICESCKEQRQLEENKAQLSHHDSCTR
jgi:hypothetical protein